MLLQESTVRFNINKILCKILLILIFSVSTASAQSWTLVDQDELYAAAASTTIQRTMAMSAGNLVYVCVGSFGTNVVNSVTLNSGAQVLTPLGFPISDGVEAYDVFWTTSSTQSGTVTVDATYASSTTDRSITVSVFSFSGTASGDGFNADSGTTATINTAALTTTGTDNVTIACANSSQGQANWTINGLGYSSAAYPYSVAMWWRYANAPFTGAGAADLGGAAFWAAHIHSFKATASVSSTGSKLSLTGAGGK
jgi:hypothetical protein